MNYKRKRTKAGIHFTTMVKELGIPEQKYKEVEEGKRNLEGNMLDKFMDIIRKGKELKINDTVKIKEVNEWLTNGGLEKSMKDYGYETQRELAKALEMSQCTISFMITGKRFVSDNLKLKLYNFLHDPLNKKIKEEKIEVIDEKEDEVDYIKWAIDNIEKEWKKSKKTQRAIEKDLGVSYGYICHLIRKDSKPSKELAEKIYKYFKKDNESKTDIKHDVKEEKENNQKQPKTTEEQPKNNQENSEEIIEEVKNVVKDMKNDLIIMKKDMEIKKLKRQIMLYEKLIERL